MFQNSKQRAQRKVERNRRVPTVNKLAGKKLLVYVRLSLQKYLFSQYFQDKFHKLNLF